MVRGSKRLRNLDFDEDDAELVQGVDEFEAENEEANEENMQGPPDIDNILAGLAQKPVDPIKIICKFQHFCLLYIYTQFIYFILYIGPDGDVRQVVGDFRVSNLLDLQGGKVIVGTDENGVPNERSASILGQHLGDIAESSTFAPLNIPRWDNKLFNTLKVKIIKDVEVNFPRQC